MPTIKNPDVVRNPIKNDSEVCGPYLDVFKIENYALNLALFDDIKETEAHYHKGFQEIYTVLEGEIHIQIWELHSIEINTIKLEKNQSLKIEKEWVHQIIFASQPNKLLVTCYPPYNKEDAIKV